jgi:hypothetical protein
LESDAVLNAALLLLVGSDELVFDVIGCRHPSIE